MNGIKFGISLVGTILVIYLLNSSWVTPFRIGYFFSPFHGFWQNASAEAEGSNESFSLKGLKGGAEVITDENLVPHIFANSQGDAAFIQGYITARDRFWQMDFQVRAAAGRLSEVVGEKVLPIDKEARGKGLAWAAEKTTKEMEQHPETFELLKSYSDGVNAYLETLQSSDYPLEFKLMDYEPEKWSPLKTVLLLKYMANMLAFKNDDIAYTHLQKALGKETFAMLYPENPIVKATIVPEGTTWSFENEHPVSTEAGTTTPAGAKKSSFKPKPKPKPKGPRRVVQPDGSILIIGAQENSQNPNPIVADNQESVYGKPEKGWGSNNWAVSPEKSATGAALLANDPHLGLGLPAIWYEVQISTNEGNTYGVSLPGAPGIIIGFNDSIAWGVTNSERDVIDYYKLEYKDNTKQEYKKGKDWAVIDKHKEKYIVKGGKDVEEEVLYTDFGPIINDPELGDLAIRWIAHEPSNEALTFLQLNKAKNYQDYVNALKSYQCPAQNFVFASRSGDIAIWQQGKFPNKGQGQGVTVLDASDSSSYWQHYIPQGHNPHVLNPERGYVSSTNQASTDGSYPYFYHQNMVECFRNRRLNERLDSMRKVSIDDMKNLQLDTYSLLASEALPTMLGDLDLNKLRSEQKIGYDSLKKWNYHFNKDYVSPSVFDVWWYYVQKNIWDDDLKNIKG
ncbi:MAG: penicillin acylase family protein, partial [Bacteroidia bacterium]